MGHKQSPRGSNTGPYEPCFTPMEVKTEDGTSVYTSNGWVTEAEILEAVTKAEKQHETILGEADRIVSTHRNQDYGHPLDDFGKVVGMALALWGRGPETEEEHAIYMIFVKLAREANLPKRDNRVDGAGYFKTLDMVIEERGRRE